MQVAVDADEHFLNQVLRLLAVADRPVDEVQQPRLIAIDQLLKCPLLTAEEGSHHARVFQTA